jgi:hypothetical protein
MKSDNANSSHRSAPVQGQPRRTFLKPTGATIATLAAWPGLAPSVLAARAPGEVIGIGMIGLGTRGGDLIHAVAPIRRVKVKVREQRRLTPATAGWRE